MRISPRIHLTALLLVFVLLAAACSSEQPAEVEAEAPTAPAPTVVVEPTNTPLPPAEATPTPAAEAAPAAEAIAESIRFVVDPAQSEARFIIDEELMGSPKTVVGTNSSVSGEVTVSPGDSANVQIGPIAIDANNFVTDSNQRNGAIRRFILQSSSYPTITFTPTAVEGVPASVAVGDTLVLQVTGDLTIREVTRSETFAVTVQVVSESELHINGTAEVLRENYELTIPSVPSVANVTNEVQLEFDFVATAQ